MLSIGATTAKTSPANNWIYIVQQLIRVRNYHVCKYVSISYLKKFKHNLIKYLL
jgi:hypothetical protein